MSDETPKAKPSAKSSGASSVAAAAIGGALLVVVLAMANYLAFRHYARWDWTSSGVFTLSARTEEVLRRLSANVEVNLLLPRNDSNFQEVKDLFDRYRAKSSRITLHAIDPARDQAEYIAIARRYEIADTELPSVVAIVVSGDRHWNVNAEDMLSLDAESLDDQSGNVTAKVKSEEALTGAILQVTTGRPTKVCATRGHGEWALEGDPEHSLRELSERLSRANVQMSDFATLGAASVPSDCDAVFVIGPTSAFSEAEANLLLAYVRGGGNLFAALEPVITRERIEPTGLEHVASELGLDLDANLVLTSDRQFLMAEGQKVAFYVADYGEHTTTNVLRRTQSPSAMILTRSIRKHGDSHAVELLRSSEGSYGESSVSEIAGEVSPTRNGDDMAGPLSLAVAVEVGEANARHGKAIFVGSTQWMRGQFVNEPQLANTDLLSAWVGWLTQRPALISIEPRRVNVRAVMMTPEDLDGLLFRVLGLMPAAALLLGFAVYWSRRS